MLEHSVHQIHKGCWGICESKGHDQKLEVTISGFESYFWNAIFSDSELIIAKSEVYLRKVTGTLQLVEQVIYSRKWILILNYDLVQQTIVNTHSKGTIFPTHEQNWYALRENTGPDESFIQKIIQLLFQIFNFEWSHSVWKNRDRLGIWKKVYSEVNFLFRRNSKKIFREHIQKFPHN